MRWLLVLLAGGVLGTAEFAYPPGFYATDGGGQPAQVGEIGCVNVRAYGAVGDGVADDTAAINAALLGTRSQSGRPPDYYSARPRTVYLPPGTYRVTDTLSWTGINLTLRGAGRADTVIRLDDACAGFTDAASPRPVVRSSQTANYGFSNNVRDLTIDTGSGNPGAIGIVYNANNVGALQNVRISGSGVRGIDMTSNWPGPCLLKRIEVQGFAVGIDLDDAEYGPTFEDITLSGQTVAGIRNLSNVLAIRRLVSTNGVPAVVCTGGASHLILLDADLTGGTSGRSAIELASGAEAYLREVFSSGYASALKTGSTTVAGADVAERVVGTLRHGFGTLSEAQARLSLKLPVQETPAFHDNDVARWGRLQRSPANGDITSGMRAGNQAIFDNPAHTTVWLNTGTALAGVPGGTALEDAGFRVPPHIRRVTAFATNFNKYSSSVPYGLVLRVEDDDPDPLIIDDMRGAVLVYHRSARTVVLRNGQFAYRAAPGAGRLFLEDVGMDNVTTVPGQRVWARQLNIEGSQLHLDNDGGDLWVLGLKSEFGGMIARTRNGGRTEFLGTLLYPLQPAGTAFEILDAHASLSYVTSNYAGDYAVQVRERRSAASVETATGASGQRYAMPLYVGWTSDRAAACVTGDPAAAAVGLSARADGAGGAVTWTSQPPGVQFSPNGTVGAAQTTAAFPGPGTWTLTATFADGSHSTVVLSRPSSGATPGGGGAGGCGGVLGGLVVAVLISGALARRGTPSRR